MSGIPPFSGFYSKDSIFAQALEQKNYLLFGVAVFVAALTAFYTFRLFFVVFFGKEKSEAASHAHESPPVMTLPLVVLAVFAAIGGFIGIANNYGSQFIADHETLSVVQQLLEPLHNADSDADRHRRRRWPEFSWPSRFTKMPPAIRCPPNSAAWRRR